MEEKKSSSEASANISQMGIMFDVKDIDLNVYVSQDNLKKLSEKLGKKLNIVSIAFSIPEINTAVILMVSAQEEKRGVMITSEKKFAQTFYDALLAVKKERNEKP
jgi:hypothetical protein